MTDEELRMWCVDRSHIFDAGKQLLDMEKARLLYAFVKGEKDAELLLDVAAKLDVKTSDRV